MTPPKSEYELKREVIEEEHRFASLVDKLETRLSGPGGPLKDHETRLRDLEKWQRYWMGIGVCAGLLVTMFVGIATSAITEDVRKLRQSIVEPVKK